MSTPVYTLCIRFVDHMAINWEKTLNFGKCFSVGTPYSPTWQGKWEYLYSLSKDQPNNGFFSFSPKPADSFSSWEIGSVRVSSSSYTDGMPYVQTLPIIYECNKKLLFLLFTYGFV